MKFRGTFNPGNLILWTPPLLYYDLETLIVDRRLLVVNCSERVRESAFCLSYSNDSIM